MDGHSLLRSLLITLLMFCRCDSNPAQYERNRRFGHLVHVLGRVASGAKLPSVGLRLNASKSESRLVTATIPFVPFSSLGNVSWGVHPFGDYPGDEAASNWSIQGPRRLVRLPFHIAYPVCVTFGRQIACRRLVYLSGCRT